MPYKKLKLSLSEETSNNNSVTIEDHTPTTVREVSYLANVPTAIDLLTATTEQLQEFETRSALHKVFVEALQLAKEGNFVDSSTLHVTEDNSNLIGAGSFGMYE
jgi:hypothetical protein